jgi:hypothetical protein
MKEETRSEAQAWLKATKKYQKDEIIEGIKILMKLLLECEGL